jgi:hypothetical protein
LGIFGFRRSKTKDEPGRDDGLDAAVAAVGDVPAGEVPSGDGVGVRDLTQEQRLRFEERLLAQDLERARGVALGYAFKRVWSRQHRDRERDLALARHLVDSAQTIAWERASWDPDQGSPSLAVYLCSIIRSELSHEAEAAENQEKTAEAAQLEPSTSPDALPDPEQLVMAKAEHHADASDAAADLAWLRAFFAKKKDAVNLRWLDLRAEGVDDEPAAMAARSEYSADDFYNAQKRRIRAARRLLAHKQGRRDDDEETE